MNILPKKRWHVRTKDNVARVRRDEAQAAAEEKAIIERAALAEQEARTRFLRDKATQKRSVNDGGFSASNQSAQSSSGDQKDISISASDGHVNFFADLEEQERTFGTNKDYEKEKRLEKESEERKIGLLKYLGEGSTEYMKNDAPWYQKVPNKINKQKLEESVAIVKHSEIKTTVSEIIFPSDVGLLPKKEKLKKHKKHKHKKSKKRRRSTSSSNDRSDSPAVEQPTLEISTSSNIDKLRAERLQRENQERLKAENLLRRLKSGNSVDEPVKKVGKADNEPEYTQKYSSQFNPQLARQNR